MDDSIALSPAECRELLETDTVGRVGFVAPGGPRILPVNFALVGEAIELRTTAFSELARHAPGHQIAFEIDHLDTERRRGWSVVAQGLCEWVHDPDAFERNRGQSQPQPQPWAAGARPVHLRLAWRELTGRRVGGSHWPHPVVSGRARGY